MRAESAVTISSRRRKVVRPSTQSSSRVAASMPQASATPRGRPGRAMGARLSPSGGSSVHRPMGFGRAKAEAAVSTTRVGAFCPAVAFFRALSRVLARNKGR